MPLPANPTDPAPRRGEVWLVDMEPSVGAEMTKFRPCVVVSRDSVGRLPLRLIVPLTTWQPQFATISWLVQITADPGTGLRNESAADTFQMRSFSLLRFQRKLGELSSEQMRVIAETIAFTVGN